MVDRSLTQTVPGRELVAQGQITTDYAMAANGLFIGAGAAALSAGVIALFTDWYGYGDP